jgi:hypothetical protein
MKCQVPKSTRYKTCVSCKKKKKKCLMKGLVSRLVATGRLGTAEESEILDKSDVMALGLGRGPEMIMLQVVSFQQEVRDRLDTIEARLKVIETGGGHEDHEDDDGNGNG